jgi:hypothetical protein
MTWLYILVGALAVIVLSHQGLIYAENRGRIFYRHRPRIRSIGFLEELVQPSIEYMIEEQASEEERADHAASDESE